MHRRLSAFALTVLLAASTARVAAGPLQGVWKGTLGTKAITACFNGGQALNTSGSYYYADFLSPIGLSSSDAHRWKETSYSGQWQQGRETGSWQLADPADGIVTGTWTNTRQQGPLPIRLQYVEGRNDEGACGGDSYNLALESRPPMVERGRSVTYLPGRSYRKLWLADQATVELIGTGPGLDKINAAIRPDQRPEILRQFFAKRRDYLVRFGIPGLDEREVEPDFWDSNFVTLRSHEWVNRYRAAGHIDVLSNLGSEQRRGDRPATVVPRRRRGSAA